MVLAMLQQILDGQQAPMTLDQHAAAAAMAKRCPGELRMRLGRRLLHRQAGVQRRYTLSTMRSGRLTPGSSPAESKPSTSPTPNTRPGSPPYPLRPRVSGLASLPLLVSFKCNPAGTPFADAGWQHGQPDWLGVQLVRPRTPSLTPRSPLTGHRPSPHPVHGGDPVALTLKVNPPTLTGGHATEGGATSDVVITTWRCCVSTRLKPRGFQGSTNTRPTSEGGSECLTVSTPARFVSAVAGITPRAFRSRSSVCPQERQRKVRSDGAGLCLALAERALRRHRRVGGRNGRPPRPARSARSIGGSFRRRRLLHRQPCGPSMERGEELQAAGVLTTAIGSWSTTAFGSPTGGIMATAALHLRVQLGGCAAWRRAAPLDARCPARRAATSHLPLGSGPAPLRHACRALGVPEGRSPGSVVSSHSRHTPVDADTPAVGGERWFDIAPRTTKLAHQRPAASPVDPHGGRLGGQLSMPRPGSAAPSPPASRSFADRSRRSCIRSTAAISRTWCQPH